MLRVVVSIVEASKARRVPLLERITLPEPTTLLEPGTLSEPAPLRGPAPRMTNKLEQVTPPSAQVASRRKTGM